MVKHYFETISRTGTCKHRRKPIKTTSSWFFCVSIRCCDISLLSSSHVRRGSDGLCSARFLSWISLCHQHGKNTRPDYNSHTGRNMLPRKKRIFPCLSPFGKRDAAVVTRRSSERVNTWCHPVFIYVTSRDHSCATQWMGTCKIRTSQSSMNIVVCYLFKKKLYMYFPMQFHGFYLTFVHTWSGSVLDWMVSPVVACAADDILN